MFRTRRLRLIPGTPRLLRADIAGGERLARALGFEVPGNWPPELYDRPAMEWTLNYLEKDPANAEWGLFYLIGEDGRLVGLAGYKGRPDSEGTVEIGYGVLPEYQRQGIAAEATGGLIERAFGFSGVKRVIAETLPPLLPSIRVMEKNGLRLIGEGSEHGVIRFELTREDYQAGRRDIPSHLRVFLKMLGHQSWADAAALRAIRNGQTASSGALKLLAHILGAEHVWLSRLNGVAPTQAVWPELTFDQCRQLAAANELGLRQAIFGLEQADLRRIVTYKNSAGEEFQTPVEDILTHLFLHGSYHRGQIAMQLRLAESTPESTDFIAFARGAPAATRQAK